MSEKDIGPKLATVKLLIKVLNALIKKQKEWDEQFYNAEHEELNKGC